MSARNLGGMWALFISLLVAIPLKAQEVHYTYDADGRLVAQGPAVDGIAITGFAPSYGSANVAVSIQGQGFDPVAENNQVSFGGVAAVVDSVRPDLIVARVPVTATTGPIAVTVQGKRAQSAREFVILPAGGDLSGIVGGGIIPLDGVFHPYSSLAGRGYALSFAASTNAYISLDVDTAKCMGLTTTGLAYKLFNPSGSVVIASSIVSTSPTILAPKAATAGTYTLLVSGSQAWTCPISAQVDPSYKADDSPIHLVTNLPFHKKRISFDVPVGGAFGVGTSQLATKPAGGAMNMYFYGPSGESAGSYACGYINYGECQGQIVYRPPGTYTAVMQPYDTRTQTVDTQFWLTNYIDGGSFEPNSTVHPVIEKPGQVVRYTFQGHSGQLLRLVATDKSFQGTGAWLDVITGKDPTGECIFQYCSIESPINPYDFAKLRYDGTYTLFYYLRSIGTGAPTGSINLTLSDTVDTEIPSGTDHVDVATTVNAQQIRVPIEVKAGEDISISLTDINSQPSPFYIRAKLLRPDDSQAATFNCGTGYGACFTTLQGAAPGTYYLLVSQADTRTKTFSARVWRVPFVEAGPLDINSTENIVATLPGQVLRYTVSGKQGQLLHFYLENVHPGPGGQNMTLTGTNPTGQCFFDDNYYCSYGASSNGLYDLPSLRLDGTYKLLVYFGSNGNQAAFGTGTISLTATKTVSVVPGDWSASVNADLKGQTARGVIDVQAGESITLAATDVQPISTNGFAIKLYAPNGSLARDFYCGYSGPCSLSMLNAASGVYAFEARSFNNLGNTFSATLWKSAIVDAGVITPGVPLRVSVDRPGNLVRLRVVGKVGNAFTLSVTDPILGANAGKAGVSGRGADGTCAFSNNYYCDVTTGGTAAAIGPLATDTTRDIYFYVSGNGRSASTGAATVILTPVN